MMFIPGRKVLLFPVEIATRELDFRLVLANLCASQENQIFIGNHTDVYELGKRLRNGVYVGKNLLNTSRTRVTECYRDLKRQGFRVVFLHEEGAVFGGQNEDWRTEMLKKFDPRWMEAEDHVCTWGRLQAEFYRELAPACGANIHVTGHPRMHLGELRFRPIYAEERRTLQERFGPRIILLNTNFTRSNSATGPDYFFRLFDVKPNQTETRTYYFDNYCYSQTRLIAFLQLVNRLSNEFPEHQIVLRPHPSEGSEIYETMLRHVPRVKLVREGSLTAWLQAAEVLVHSGCTTGIEAVLCGCPVVNFLPRSDHRFDCRLPNQMGVLAHNDEEAIAAVRALLAGKASQCVSDEAKRELADLIENSRAGVDAYAALTSLVKKVEQEVEPTEVTGSLARFQLLGKREKIRRMLRAIQPSSLRRAAVTQAHLKNKFPGLVPEEVRRRLATIRQVTGKAVRSTFYSSKLMSVVATKCD